MGQIIQGDALVELRKLSSDSIDALCCDPPAAVSFMGKSWDGDKGGRDQWVTWLAEIMQEALRVMKPGAHGLVWALPRTSHWTALALEDAGYEIKDCCYHLFGSGFPKSHDISKAIDRMAGVEREVIGYEDGRGVYDGSQRIPREKFTGNVWNNGIKGGTTLAPITVPATEVAQTWEGWGTALKPSCEVWWLVRKPLSEKSIAENVLKWGVGGLNIDGCRVGNDLMVEGRMTQSSNGVLNCNGRDIVNGNWKQKPNDNPATHIGRWPANFLLSHTLFCDESGCAEGCPALLLDKQSGNRKSGSTERSTYGGIFGTGKPVTNHMPASEGGASRFFQQFYYCSKASRKDRTTNYAVENTHPTCKNTELIRYLTRLICPPGGIVLDCFAGSGTTALACIAEGFDYILIEQDEAYCDIARARVSQITMEG